MVVEKLKCQLQYVLPQHWLSRIIAKLADCRIPLVKDCLIKAFIYCYKVDLNTAATNKLSAYPSFNHFFVRSLNATARPIAKEQAAVVSPADGVVSQVGKIHEGKLYQAKGRLFSLAELLGEDNGSAKRYEGGEFITIYLAPHDYHRVHMPLAGKLLRTTYVPGKLFSVNARSVANVPNLFCRNERLISFFATEVGEIALIMVGAMLVAGIETVWGQGKNLGRSRKISADSYLDKNIQFSKAQEMGHFKFGSTVILLFPPDKVQLSEFVEQQPIKMGSSIGHVLSEGK